MTGIMTTRARRLRKDMTDAEKSLWKHLRVLNQEGYHSRRQAPVGPYIADFIEHARKLVIECDGDQHVQGSGPARDARRDAWFSTQRYTVIRVSNREALTNTDGVMVTILEHCGVRVGANEVPVVLTPHPTPPPQGAGEGWGGGDSRDVTASPHPVPPHKGEGTQAASSSSRHEMPDGSPLPSPPPQRGRETVPLAKVRASGRRRRGTGITS